MRALLAQAAPTPGDPLANAAAVERALAGATGVALAVFPELFLTGYDPPAAADRAIGLGHPAVRAVREAAAAHRVAVVVGLAERRGARVSNSAAVLGPAGELVAVYRKTHLFGAAERAAFVPGEELVVARVAGRRAGLLICFDLEFPEPARALARAGADLLVAIAANPAALAADHALAARARALDNRRPLLYVDRPGAEAGVRFAGESRAVDQDGAVLAEAGRDAALTVVDLPAARQPAAELDYVGLARGPLPVATAG